MKTLYNIFNLNRPKNDAEQYLFGMDEFGSNGMKKICQKLFPNCLTSHPSNIFLREKVKKMFCITLGHSITTASAKKCFEEMRFNFLEGKNNLFR